MSLYKGNNLISGAMPNSANQSLSNLNSAGQDIIDGKVSKTGDTMAGNLDLQSSVIERSAVPNENLYTPYLNFTDKNGDNLANIYFRQSADGSKRLQITCRDNSNIGNSLLTLGYHANGDAYCTFPNTECVDGQWVYKNTSLGSGVTWNSSSHSDAKSYSLSSYLPNDGRKYEVLIRANGTTTSTSGKWISVGITSDIITTSVYACACRTRTASTQTCAGSVIIPVGSGRKISVSGTTYTSSDGTYDLRCLGYRRIGLNS